MLGVVEHSRKPLNALWMYRWLMTTMNLTRLLGVVLIKLVKLHCPVFSIESQLLLSFNLYCQVTADAFMKYSFSLNLSSMTGAQLKLPRLYFHSVPISQRAESECLSKEIIAMAFCHALSLLKHGQHHSVRQFLIGTHICVAASHEAIPLLHLESVGTAKLFHSVQTSNMPSNSCSSKGHPLGRDYFPSY